MIRQKFASRAAEPVAAYQPAPGGAMRVADDIVPIAEFKASLSETVRSLEQRERPLIVTLNGKPAAVVMSPREYDRLSYQARFVAGVNQGLADVAAGRTSSHADVESRMEARLTRLKKARSKSKGA